MQLDAVRLEALDDLIANEAIRQCLLRYTRGIDRHDAALVASAYHADAIDDHTMYFGPGRDFGAAANAAHDAAWEAHQHFITNTTIERAGDTAHVETYWIVAGRRHGNSGFDLHGGRYVDRFEKRAGRWAIAARVCVYEWGLRPEEAVQQLASFPLGSQDRDDISWVRPLTIAPR
jgi:ketosteroid isomerase-like protein